LPERPGLSRRAVLVNGLAGALAAPAGAKRRLGSRPAIVEEKKLIPDNVVELRQYTLHGGGRDELIELFEREFVEPQNAAGARVLGTFRDLDDPDRFVWLRDFTSMEARATALTTFYTGPVWRAHREAANATMLDSDNVLLLRPAPGSRAPLPWSDRTAPSLVTATIHSLGSTPPAAFASFFGQTLAPRLRELGAQPASTLVTETSPNSFAHLPVREGEPVFVWLAGWADAEAIEGFETRFARLSGWRDRAPAEVLPALMRKPERLRLAPVQR
jgi:hypothetical protein